MLARELMSNEASVCWIVNVIFIWAIMPTFWLLAALNSHTPEKSARGAAARIVRAVNRKATADNFSLMHVSFHQARLKKRVLAHKPSLESVLRYRVKRILRRVLEPVSWSGHRASWRPGRSFQGSVPGNVKQAFADVFCASCQGAGPGLKLGKSSKT